MFVVIVICHGSQYHTIWDISQLWQTNQTYLCVPTSMVFHFFDRLIKPVFFPTLCRFIFCQTVLSLYAPVSNKKEFLPTCVPSLPKPVLSPSYSYHTVILHLADIFGATKYFSFSDDVLPENMHTDVNQSWLLWRWRWRSFASKTYNVYSFFLYQSGDIICYLFV